MGFQLGQHVGVMFRRGQHRHRGVVFRRRADHRRAADIDILDAILERSTPRHRRLERVEIDRHQIDRRDVVVLHLLQMLRQIAPAEHAAMDLRHQGFHAPVENFREAGMVRDFLHRHAGIAQRLGRAAGGEDFHALAPPERVRTRPARLCRKRKSARGAGETMSVMGKILSWRRERRRRHWPASR